MSQDTDHQDQLKLISEQSQTYAVSGEDYLTCDMPATKTDAEQSQATHSDAHDVFIGVYDMPESSFVETTISGQK